MFASHVARKAWPNLKQNQGSALIQVGSKKIGLSSRVALDADLLTKTPCGKNDMCVADVGQRRQKYARG